MTPEELAGDDNMATCVATLKYLKGNFKRHDREEEYLYDALAVLSCSAPIQTDICTF